MNCANHTDVAAVAYCRTCGKPLCANCRHEVRGVIYCEDCIATRLQDPGAAATVPPPAAGFVPAAPVAHAEGSASPIIAALLGFIPGVGAMFNGQFIKGLIHVAIFATLCWGADHVGGGADVFFGFGIAFWEFYMVFDAFKTARAKITGEPLPDPFGFERLWGSGTGTTASAAVPVAGQVPPAGMPPDACDVAPRAPVGAFVLIGLGVLFLLNTMGWFHWHWMGRFWPVFLIALGVWTWIRRRPPVEG
jgi:TM2 domain-containing membrane protein YozV